MHEAVRPCGCADLKHLPCRYTHMESLSHLHNWVREAKYHSYKRSIFLKLQLAIGQDCFTAIWCQVYLKPTTTWIIFPVLCVIITAVVQYARVDPASFVLLSVQLIACVATQLTTFVTQRLASVPLADWYHLRSHLHQHRLHRVKQLRFRRSPVDYVANKQISATLANFASVKNY